MRLKPIICIFLFMISMQPLCVSADQYSGIDQYLYPQNQKTISMDLKGANLNDVLKMFSQQSGMNFIAASDVSALTVNLYLDQVPVDEALERILAANNLTYELQENGKIFLVKKLKVPAVELMTRVYQLKNATIPSSKLNSTLSAFETAKKSTAGSDSEGIVSAIKAILTENGRVIEYARTNSLVITDIPSQFDHIERTIKRLDVSIPQILIEVEMLDISKGTSELLGAKWGNTPLTFSGGSQRGLHPFDFDNIIQDNVLPEEQIPGATTEFLEGQDLGNESNRYTASNVSFEGLSVMLQFLRTKSDTRSLARPRILTLNNETAEIRISTDEAIGVQSSTSGGSSATESLTEAAERAKTGIILTVTPQANIETGEIIMAIEPKVIEASTASGFVGAQNYKNTEERGSKSILRVNDGDTIILGGLLRSDESDIREHVPVMSKIPVVGAAFRHKNKSEAERELIIFITPQILDENYAKEINPTKPKKIVREQGDSAYRDENIERELTYIEGKN
ncbi:MAG: secretin and TonB N-terminal domain-containing protein [Candidatus Omnitrophica bacterium]|nr:secretin and TonB N-terminal domain-containing protein [Candidatus Omnitrophota bacterium]